MHVILIAPEFPSNQRNFVYALKAAGAYVSGIGERPKDWLGELGNAIDSYEQVSSVVHDNAMIGAVRNIQRRGPWVHRLESTIEAHILTAARVRAATGIPGQSPESAMLCRDKPQMKDFLRRHGIPTAASAGVSTLREAIAFARTVGYPLIVKPRAGAGAAGTSRVNNDTEMAAAIEEASGSSVAIEEFIEGHEGFYDTLTINGRVAVEFVSHYYPNVLPAMRTRSYAPQIVSTNRLDAPGYDELKKMGRDVIKALGLDTCATHMEWFYGPKGLKFSEIGARPPGVSQWDVYNTGNDIDLYRQWAEGLVNGRTTARPSRRFASAKIALRPEQDGRVTGYSGLEEVQRRYGPHIVHTHLPNIGSRTQPIDAGYHANAWMVVRHPNYDILRGMLTDIGKIVTVHAS